MKKVLIDTSVWIEYFSGNCETKIEKLIDERNICTNEIILTELKSFLNDKKRV